MRISANLLVLNSNFKLVCSSKMSEQCIDILIGNSYTLVGGSRFTGFMTE